MSRYLAEISNLVFTCFKHHILFHDCINNSAELTVSFLITDGFGNAEIPVMEGDMNSDNNFDVVLNREADRMITATITTMDDTALG